MIHNLTNGGIQLTKKSITKLTAAAMVGTALIPAAVAVDAKDVEFKDLKKTNEYYEPLMELVERGVMKGYKNDTIRPYGEATRGQVAKMIAQTIEIDTKNVVDPGFTDVKKDGDLYGPIAALKEAGIIGGYADGTFRPNAKVTRGQVAKMVALAYDFKSEGKGDNPFKDIKDDSELLDYVKSLQERDIIKGYKDGTFKPNAKVRRGQVAKMLVNGEAKHEKFDLTIMHSNDTHGRVEAAPSRLTAVKQVRKLKPNSLLLDGGDVFTGTLYFNEFQGQADLEFMNMMQYDAMTFGNHEFDLGSSPDGHQALADFIKAASFPLLGGNIDFSKDPVFKGLFETKFGGQNESGNIYKGIVKEVNGEKYGIFGLTTTDTEGISSPLNVKFEDYVKEAKAIVEHFESEGINRIIAVTHLGFDDIPGTPNDQQLAAQVPQIDIIVGGHSHSKVEPPKKVDNGEHGPTIIVQANEYSKYLGTLDVSFNEDGIITKHKGELIDLGKVKPDAEGEKVLQKYKKKIDEVMNEKIGVTAKEELTNPRLSDKTGVSVRSHETALGNIITDGMLQKAKQLEGDNPTVKTIFAMQNGGGIRSSLPAGDITVGQIITILPFGNTLSHVDLTGKEIKEVFEHSFAAYPNEFGGFLHVSGGQVTVDTSKPAGERVQEIAYEEDGKLVKLNLEDDSTKFRIATNAFTAKGGDDYTTLGKAFKEGRVGDYGDMEADWENLKNRLLYMKENNIEIKDVVENRIINVAEQK